MPVTIPPAKESFQVLIQLFLLIMVPSQLSKTYALLSSVATGKLYAEEVPFTPSDLSSVSEKMYPMPLLVRTLACINNKAT